jgi:hypothetical protein
MRSRNYKTPCVVALSFLLLAPGASTSQHKQDQHKQNQPKHEKNIWNYDGGVFFETDGSLPNGVCFRIYGRVTSENFFDNLKRVDTDEGTVFRRGTKTVTQFPDSLTVSYAIRDEACPSGIQKVGSRAYMTQEMMENLRLSIYWKHGVELRPLKNIKLLDARVDHINPYATALAAELPRRYEWSYELSVPSEGVPLSDSLVFVFRAPDEHIAARVAARL